MNAEKLAKMQAQVRIGGKGTARRKKKVVRRSSTTDDKKLQSSLKKLSVNNISGIEEVNMIKDDGSVIHFNNPKVQASLNANTFAVSGHAENKQITEMLPSILNHLGSEGFNQLKRLASTVNTANVTSSGLEEDDDDVPDLVEDFEAASKNDPGLPKNADSQAAENEDEDIPPLISVDKVESNKAKDLISDLENLEKKVANGIHIDQESPEKPDKAGKKKKPKNVEISQSASADEKANNAPANKETNKSEEVKSEQPEVSADSSKPQEIKEKSKIESQPKPPEGPASVKQTPMDKPVPSSIGAPFKDKAEAISTEQSPAQSGIKADVTQQSKAKGDNLPKANQSALNKDDVKAKPIKEDTSITKLETKIGESNKLPMSAEPALTKPEAMPVSTRLDGPELNAADFKAPQVLFSPKATSSISTSQKENTKMPTSTAQQQVSSENQIKPAAEVPEQKVPTNKSAAAQKEATANVGSLKKMDGVGDQEVSSAPKETPLSTKATEKKEKAPSQPTPGKQGKKAKGKPKQ